MDPTTSYSLTIAPDELRAMLDHTLFSAADEHEKLPALTGIYLCTSDGRLRFVASDGHRLSFIDRPLNGTLPPDGIVLPTTNANACSR